MKNYINISRKLMAKIGAVCLITVVLSSCLKNNDTYYNPPVALVTLTQAMPDQPPLDFYLNYNKVNSFPLTFGGNIDYFRAYTGTRIANFYLIGTMTTVFSDTVTFKPNYIYSVFLANKVSSPELVVLTDTISKPASGMANVRFINLSPDAPAVDLVVKDGATVVSNRAYKGYSSFMPIAGNTSYTFEVNKGGTSTVLATLTVILNSGSEYTLWLQGLATPLNSSDGLSINIKTNAIY
jgi:hypothetical protein